MIDYFLKFSSKYEMQQKFIKHKLFEHQPYIEIDLIGELILQDPILDENFNIIQDAIIEPSYHVNLRCSESLSETIINDLPLIYPKTPKKIFA